MRFLLPLSFSILAGCSSSPDHPAPAPPPAAVQLTHSDAIQATFLDWRGGKPPLTFNSLDLALHNPSAEPRWLLIPATFPSEGQPWQPHGREACELQPYLLSESPRVLWIYGVCGGFHAAHLPGDGTLEVAGVIIDSWWEDLPTSVELELIVARELRVGGQSMDALLGMPTASATGASVQAHVDAGDGRVLPMWHPNVGAKLAVELDVEARVATTVVIEP